MCRDVGGRVGVVVGATLDGERRKGKVLSRVPGVSLRYLDCLSRSHVTSGPFLHNIVLMGSTDFVIGMPKSLAL